MALLCAELDSATAITQVGVSQFVLCRETPQHPVLLLNIPSGKVVFHACETQQEVPTLAVTCQPANRSSPPMGASAPAGAATGKRNSFVVHLQHHSAQGVSGSTATSSATAAAVKPGTVASLN